MARMRGPVPARPCPSRLCPIIVASRTKLTSKEQGLALVWLPMRITVIALKASDRVAGVIPAFHVLICCHL